MTNEIRIFEVLEWIFCLSGLVGFAVAWLATLDAWDDYRQARGRVRLVAWKNVISQSGKGAPLLIIGFIGAVSISQPPTAGQLDPATQTWLFYVGMSAAAVILSAASIYTHYLYRRLIDTAHQEDWDG